MTASHPPSRIFLQGCRQHNLKNISVSFPKHAITVLTGVSGSGKSSLAFDTLFAEGQRRYLEYLSSQIRVWIKQMPKPEVEIIEGLSPTLAVGRRRCALSSNGTIATYTDIHDFLALLYAALGQQHSPATGKKLIKHSRQEMIDLMLTEYPRGTKLQLLAPIKLQRESIEQAVARLQQMGFIRFKIQNEEWSDEQPLPIYKRSSDSAKTTAGPYPSLEVVIDRLEIKGDVRERLAASLETALDLSQGILKIQEGRAGPFRYFTEIYVCPETSFAFVPLEPLDFNFNSPRGSCPICRGKGGAKEVDPSLIFLNKEASWTEQIRLLFDQLPKKMIVPFQDIFQLFIESTEIKKGTKIKDVPSELFHSFLHGSSHLLEFKSGVENLKTRWQGFIPFVNRLLREKKTRGSLSDLPFVRWKPCSGCQGARLKPESLACLLKGKNIDQLCQLTVSQLLVEMQGWHFTGKEAAITKDILPAIQTRLHFLERVGLGYLELNRVGNTLSDGEAQRVQLAAQIGAKLSGLIYILDEPSLGLHRQDIEYLQQVIEELKQLGNTIVMVEHERKLISQADYVVELGPGAGRHGGSITFQGSYQELLEDRNNATGEWLSGRKKLPAPPRRKPNKGWLHVKNASFHNLDRCSIKIPLGCLVGFCGVSGSGKSTLALDVIGMQLRRYLIQHTSPECLRGYEGIKRIIMSEKFLERFSARSIPATYVNLMNPLRQLFAQTRLAKARGYTPARFSINKRGGRCEACEGVGQIHVNMQLMPDLFIPCDVCRGSRYNYETLQATWENRHIADVLAMSVDEAAQFFSVIPSLASSLELMQELGLGYLTLGQPFHTLSGGEIQRLKLVADLVGKMQEPTLYILDEPSAGLHFEDISKLSAILHRLVDSGHSVFIIEHHLDLLRQADWLIELGPGGGALGGKLIFEGTPSQLAKAATPTGRVFA